MATDDPDLMYLSDAVQTRPQATVEVEISEDMQLVHFDFNRCSSFPFLLVETNLINVVVSRL